MTTSPYVLLAAISFMVLALAYKCSVLQGLVLTRENKVIQSEARGTHHELRVVPHSLVWQAQTYGDLTYKLGILCDFLYDGSFCKWLLGDW